MRVAPNSPGWFVPGGHRQPSRSSAMCRTGAMRQPRRHDTTGRRRGASGPSRCDASTSDGSATSTATPMLPAMHTNFRAIARLIGLLFLVALITNGVGSELAESTTDRTVLLIGELLELACGAAVVGIGALTY